MLRTISGAALGLLLAADRGGTGTTLSVQTAHHDHSVRGRRPDRRARPRHGAAHERDSRPAGGDRERRRRRRHDRLEARRRRRARRLHLRARHRRHPRAGPDAVQEAALQFGDRFHAGRADRRGADRADRAQGSAGEQPQGVHRLREGQPEPRCNTARPARARRPISAACCSTTSSAPTSPTCPIAAPARRCRTCRAAASTICARSSPPPSRRSTAAP